MANDNNNRCLHLLCLKPKYITVARTVMTTEDHSTVSESYGRDTHGWMDPLDTMFQYGGQVMNVFCFTDSLQPGVCGEHAGKLLLVPPDPEHHPEHRDQRRAAVVDGHLPGHRLGDGLHLLHQRHRDHWKGGCTSYKCMMFCWGRGPESPIGGTVISVWMSKTSKLCRFH